MRSVGFGFVYFLRRRALLAQWEKDRTSKNLESVKRLVELLWKGIVRLSTKAMTVRTDEGKNVQGG